MDAALSRRDRLAHALAGEGLDLLLVSNSVNVTYLTGFSGESSYLLLARDRAVLVSDGRFAEQLAQECPSLELYIRPPAQSLAEAAAAVLNQLGPRGVRFENAHLTVADHQQLPDLTKTVDWKGARERVERLRVVKDAGEVAEIRAAVRVAQ